MTDTAAIARRFLATLEARDWDAWTALMVPDVVYELPQTRESVRGRDGYLKFNLAYPGEWHLATRIVIGDAERAVVWFTCTLNDTAPLDAQVFLEFDADGMITSVTDFWPEPYDPPSRPLGLVERSEGA